MSLKDLEPNSLHILIFLRDDPPKPDDYHWALYLHQNADLAGTKYHVRGSAGRWLADHAVAKGVLKDFLLVGLVQIATIPPDFMDNVDSIFRTYDNQVNQIPGLTCRTWIFHVLELMQKPQGGRVILKCDDLAALEREVLDWGNVNAQSASRNEQPRPLYRSSLCGF
ncbi:uncharacterized protein M437DRAFT_50550 [Aureobasidium melanogenum CBS 110374]|uniref:Uncharacterized protein n=1 Tax=Aureobasidium melanogenum (strain CBS 110374) TaxID=1043003 RepID=A0A074VW84_AURM1|nr:uncharacterized protein M437DRAFT_50550 [Aureobasidium melanogenum CBS 110374]KEQ61992.1 hypothetical protein M437DRAFT_50550 [Aureobasidium melanogenum CBS 110374]